MFTTIVRLVGCSIMKLFKDNDNFHSFFMIQFRRSCCSGTSGINEAHTVHTMLQVCRLFKANEFQFQYYHNSKIKYLLFILFLFLYAIRKNKNDRDIETGLYISL